MLASAYCWQIQHIVRTLSETNYNKHILELSNIIMSLGESGRPAVISALLDEIDFRELGQKDMPRVSIL
jgi:hypothetical protein